MIKAVLPALLALLSAPLHAAPCPAPKGTPCRPTAEVKQALLTALDEVSRKRSEVVTAEFAWTNARTMGDKAEELLQCEAWLKAQDEFAASTALALERIQTAYNVGPQFSAGVAHKPTTPSTTYGWVEGLPIKWRPTISATNEEYREVVAADGTKHYIGGFPNNQAGSTSITGEVIVSYQTVIDAIYGKNPGIIAEILFHEGKHFDELAGTGWSYREPGEVMAYSAAIAHHESFELDKPNDPAANAAKENLFANEYAVKEGRLTEITLSAETEAKIKVIVENEFQVRAALINYHNQLKIDVAKLRAEEKKRFQTEAAFREQEEARRAREEAEAPERRKREFFAQMDSEAAKCGYTIHWDENHEAMIGFNGYTERFPLNARKRVPFDFGDLQLIFLMTRACGEIESRTQTPAPPACNDAAPLLRERVGRGDFLAKLEYLAAGQSGMYPAYSYCLQELLANADKIGDTKSFDKVVLSYQKRLVKRLAKEAKQERRNKEIEDANKRHRNRREPREKPDQRKDPDHDEVWRRIERL